MVKKIRTNWDPILWEPCCPVRRVDGQVRRVLRDLKDTLKAHPEGAGLSANQIGIPLRLSAIADGKRILLLVNPEIVSQKGSRWVKEGCLSFPDVWGRVRRPLEVTVSALNEWGEPVKIRATGELAHCLCHEIDHLDGKALPDYVHSPKAPLHFPEW